MSFLRYWSAIPVEEDRYLVFSRRFNRVYMLNKDLVSDRLMLSLIGLSKKTQLLKITDEAVQITHQFLELSKTKRVRPTRSLVITYLFFHYTRVLPLNLVLRLIRLISRKKPRCKLDPSAIGTLIHHIEFSANLSDCYPRTLLTAYLCLKHIGNCSIYFGVLAPTKLMHAWCVVDNTIPYEHIAEHFHYQPLVKISLSI